MALSARSASPCVMRLRSLERTSELELGVWAFVPASPKKPITRGSIATSASVGSVIRSRYNLRAAASETKLRSTERFPPSKSKVLMYQDVKRHVRRGTDHVDKQIVLAKDTRRNMVHLR
jgi:hypothetical protein